MSLFNHSLKPIQIVLLSQLQLFWCGESVKGSKKRPFALTVAYWFGLKRISTSCDCRPVFAWGENLSSFSGKNASSASSPTQIWNKPDLHKKAITSNLYVLCTHKEAGENDLFFKPLFKTLQFRRLTAELAYFSAVIPSENKRDNK